MHHRLFSQLDKQWKVTMNFWLSQVGSTGEGRLRETALSFFPSAQNAKDLDECNKSIKGLAQREVVPVRLGGATDRAHHDFGVGFEHGSWQEPRLADVHL